MTPFDRQVRAQIYRLLAAEVRHIDAATIADSRGWEAGEVGASLRRLQDGHRIHLVSGTSRVQMAHPFSGVETEYRAVIGGRWWYSNCAWDVLALLAILGDGEAHVGELVWRVVDGQVQPDGLVHLVVPAERFWDDVVYT